MSGYISREAAKEAVQNALAFHNYAGGTAASALDKIPAADVRPVVRGKWEEVEVTWLADIEDQPDALASMFCPKCQRFANHVYHYGDPTHGMNFCPNCGAEMKEES